MPGLWRIRARRAQSYKVMYGKTGTGDVDIIDSYLAQLREGAVVVNLGCGPNVQFELNNFARSVWRFQRHSRLIFADLNASAIRNQMWIPGPDNVEVATVNAATATSVLGANAVDLIVALGLFGDLAAETTDEGTGEAAWPAVLRECFELLRPAGRMVISNSVDRQPLDRFRNAVESTGLVVTYQRESEAAVGSEKIGDRRYLLVCEKSPTRKRRLPNRRLQPTTATRPRTKRMTGRRG